MNKPDTTVYLFYSDQCPACVQFKPIWKQLKEDTSVKVNYVEAESATDQYKDLQKKLNITVTSVPTIVLVKQGKTTIYNETRDKDNLLKAIKAF